MKTTLGTYYNSLLEQFVHQTIEQTETEVKNLFDKQKIFIIDFLKKYGSKISDNDFFLRYPIQPEIEVTDVDFLINNNEDDFIEDGEIVPKYNKSTNYWDVPQFSEISIEENSENELLIDLETPSEYKYSVSWETLTTPEKEKIYKYVLKKAKEERGQ